jgi:succinyl-diaminopimelate desuccinylase
MADRPEETDAELGQRLAQATLDLVNVASPSFGEAAAAGHCADLLAAAGVRVDEPGDDCLLIGGWPTDPADRRPVVLLCGHLDTVPEQENLPGVIDAAGGLVRGLGTTDMKGADAVILELLIALEPIADRLACRVGGVLFAREELPFGDSSLTPLLARTPELAGAALAVVMEPTSGVVQGGCLGNLNATVTLHGRAAHSARPWQGSNAAHRLPELIARIAAVPIAEHEFAGLTYRECVSVTGVRSGVARNVVPGTAEVDVNYRYPPGMEPAEAERRLTAWCLGDTPELATDDHKPTELEIIGHAPSGAVTLDSPLAQRLVALTGAEPEPKQAWTPVAELTAAGIPAVNYGPGDPPLAHARDEHVRIAALVQAYRTLEQLVTEGAG